ncbi:MAG: calcium:proton antiporter [Burkholderiaceae bacterium]
MTTSEKQAVAAEFSHALPRWSIGVPIAAVVALAIVWNRPLEWALIAVVSLALIAAVLAAVHHAEVVALRVGEPFGTLILAVAVTVIEAGLIVSVMLAGGPTATVVARDAVFAAVMVACTGIIGVCLVVGGLRHRELEYRIEGTSPALAVLVALATLTLVVPAYTTTTPGPSFSNLQLAFAGVMSLALYGVFVFVQTVRHRDYFLPSDVGDDASHASPPSRKTALTSFGLLAISLIAVVGLAKSLAPSIEAGVAAASAPRAVVGIAIAMLVLLPETAAAVRAAARNRLQTSLNLGIGSAIACIGLTIPTVAVVSMLIGVPLELGIPAKEAVLLVLTFVVAVLTLGSGRATVMQGAVHLALFAAFIFLALFP